MKKYILLLLTVIIVAAGILRMYDISAIPPGLYIDEVSIGLNAYDILKTGKDQYGVSHPLVFQSLGDYKVPGYIYIVAGSMAIFGKTEFAIRFPSALAGTLTILVVFFLLREVLMKSKFTDKYADRLSLLAAGILAITPWHIHFSRGGFEVVVSLFFYLCAFFLGIRFWETKKIWQIVLLSLFFLGAMYTYDSYRVVIPLTAAVGFLLGVRDTEKRKGILIASGILVIFAMPLFLFSLTPMGQARFLQASAFSENPYKHGFIQYIADTLIFIRNYFSYFSLTYLFRFGDQINRHQVNGLGILYIWQLPCIVAGVYFLTKVKNKTLKFLVASLLFIGIIPAAIAKPSPHTLRFLIGSIPYTILTTLGIYQLFVQKQKWIRYILIIVGIFALVEFGYYLHYYYVDYPKEALIDWGGSCKEVALQTGALSKKYSHVFIDANLPCISEYFLFYSPQVSFTVVKTSWRKPEALHGEKVLYVRPFYGNLSPNNFIKNIYLPNINHDIFAQMFAL